MYNPVVSNRNYTDPRRDFPLTMRKEPPFSCKGLGANNKLNGINIMSYEPMTTSWALLCRKAYKLQLSTMFSLMPAEKYK
jgi:hypothetical protein